MSRILRQKPGSGSRSITEERVQRLAARDVDLAGRGSCRRSKMLESLPPCGLDDDNLDNVDTVVLSMLRELDRQVSDSIAGIVAEARLIGDARVPRGARSMRPGCSLDRSARRDERRRSFQAESDG